MYMYIYTRVYMYIDITAHFSFEGTVLLEASVSLSKVLQVVNTERGDSGSFRTSQSCSIVLIWE